MKRRVLDPIQPHFVGHRTRLRDRLLTAGPRAMADYELLELLLTFAIPRRDVKPLAKSLLAHFGSLKAVLDANAQDLAKLPGWGSQATALVSLWRGLMVRYLESQARESELLNNPQAVWDYCRAVLEGEASEAFDVLYLSSKNRLLKRERLSEGTVDRTVVFPRRVLEGALAHHAAALIFVHNHPSGDPTPSAEDVALTAALVQAAQTVDIVVHDHLIVGQGKLFSFREQGLLPSVDQTI